MENPLQTVDISKREDFLVVGDPHLKENLLFESRELVRKIVEHARENPPRFIVILGDVLDRHNIYEAFAFDLMNTFLRDLYQIAKTFVLVGNHDRVNNSDFLSGVSPFSPMHEWDQTRIRIADKPISETIDGEEYIFAPYVPEGRFIESLNLHLPHWQKARAIFAHNTVKGARVAKRETGDVIANNIDEWRLDYPQLIAGHLHEGHEFNNILYVGTPKQQNDSESEDKGIFRMKFSPQFTYVKIPLHFPPKRKIEISADILESFQIPDDGAKYRILINSLSSSLPLVMKHPKVKEWIARGFKVEGKPISISTITESSTPLNLTGIMTAKPKERGFRENLRENVKSKPPLAEIYTRIFGEPIAYEWSSTVSPQQGLIGSSQQSLPIL